MDIKLNIAQEDISSSDAVLDIPVEMNIKAIFNEDDSLKRMSAVIKETTDEGEIEREYIYKQNNVYKETLSTRRRSKIY